MKFYFTITLLNLLSQGALKVSANLFDGDSHPSNNGNGNGNGNGGIGNANGRRVGKLGKTSNGASAADCARGLNIQLFEEDGPDGPTIDFKPDMKACKSGRRFVASTENGKKHVTLVPAAGARGQGQGQGQNSDKFVASVTDDETGAVYSISPDANGDMIVVERMQEDYGAELDPQDSMNPKERALLEDSFQVKPSSTSLAASGGGLRGLRSKPVNDMNHRNLQDAEMDVMVVWTVKAECANSNLPDNCTPTAQTYANMESRINLAVAETNTAYDLSGVNAQLRLVHMYRDPDYVEPGFSPALNELTNNGDGKLDDVHVKRAQYGADLVALIISDPQYCGIAWLGPNSGRMFSVTAWNCATGYYSFGHEIGHNLGCNHDKGTSGACSSNNYNYGWRDPQTEFRSILAYNCGSNRCAGEGTGSCTRVQRFSNNEFLYNGKAIGSETVDNARRINDVAGSVAGYFTAPNTPTSQPTTPFPTVPPPTKAPTPPPTPCPGRTLEVEITTDNYPGESSYTLTNTCGQGQVLASRSQGYYSSTNTVYTDMICVPDEDAAYEFTVNDSYGDGLCCSYGSGGYRIMQDAIVMISGGSFTSSETKAFGSCAPPPTPPPTNPSPTKIPTVSPSKEPTNSPTKEPTNSPTKEPTSSPTKEPTSSPSSKPTTGSPTNSPSKKPTDSPVKSPTGSPTSKPITDSPITSPTKAPSNSPTKFPTGTPTTKPITESPVKSPTDAPTLSPAKSPTNSPTKKPTTESPTTPLPTSSPTTSNPTSPGPTPCQGGVLEVEVVTDSYPQESSFVLTNECTGAVQAQESYIGPKTTNYCIPQGAYRFEFFDSYGDGICCSYGSGFYRVVHNGNEIIASTGDFGGSEVTTFGSCAGVPTSPPTAPSPTPSPLPIEPTVTASFDQLLGAPKCTLIGGACTSGPDLLRSRATITGASELNQPNTIDSCTDGSSGSYQSDEHNDAITVSAVGGGLLQTGGTAVVQAQVYAYSNGLNDFADFYYTDNVDNPDWKVISVGVPAGGGGVQTITSGEFILPGSAVQAVRVNFRYNDSPGPCTSGSYNDRDDLVFTVAVADAAGPPKRPGPINNNPAVPQPGVDCESIGTDKKRCAEVSSSCIWKNGKDKGCYKM